MGKQRQIFSRNRYLMCWISCRSCKKFLKVYKRAVVGLRALERPASSSCFNNSLQECQTVSHFTEHVAQDSCEICMMEMLCKKIIYNMKMWK